MQDHGNLDLVTWNQNTLEIHYTFHSITLLVVWLFLFKCLFKLSPNCQQKPNHCFQNNFLQTSIFVLRGNIILKYNVQNAEFHKRMKNVPWAVCTFTNIWSIWLFLLNFVKYTLITNDCWQWNIEHISISLKRFYLVSTV